MTDSKETTASSPQPQLEALKHKLLDLISDPKLDASKGELSTEDQKKAIQILKKMEYWLDDLLVIPGTSIRLGWDSLIGLVPGVGDFATVLLSLYILYHARQLKISRWTQMIMLRNMAVDFGIGTIPLVGDLFDVAWRSNKMNVKLVFEELEKRLEKQKLAEHKKSTVREKQAV